MSDDFDTPFGPDMAPDYFKSPEQMRAAMADPRYRSDDAYRAEVARKVALSGLFEVPLVNVQRS